MAWHTAVHQRRCAELGFGQHETGPSNISSSEVLNTHRQVDHRRRNDPPRASSAVSALQNRRRLNADLWALPLMVDEPNGCTEVHPDIPLQRSSDNCGTEDGTQIEELCAVFPGATRVQAHA